MMVSTRSFGPVANCPGLVRLRGRLPTLAQLCLDSALRCLVPQLQAHDLGLAQSVEDLAVEQLIAKAGDEALDVAVLPRAASDAESRMGTELDRGHRRDPLRSGSAEFGIEHFTTCIPQINLACPLGLFDDPRLRLWFEMMRKLICVSSRASAVSGRRSLCFSYSTNILMLYDVSPS